MKYIFAIFPVVLFLSGCSGIAPEAARDENNQLIKPTFLEKDRAEAFKAKETTEE
jgi:hypothetical protein